ncbi:MAG: hypothetical protein UY43_C0001G0121 [Candidatus Beckwithbacteria bacterium GW2011_GWC1_49_16]|nr:MAG: hypothetical protein UY43_C0001G0121 [Candidatus Beckwithbacteria bacterium GW2011_GWC1_49_16]
MPSTSHGVILGLNRDFSVMSRVLSPKLPSEGPTTLSLTRYLPPTRYVKEHSIIIA